MRRALAVACVAALATAACSSSSDPEPAAEGTPESPTEGDATEGTLDVANGGAEDTGTGDSTTEADRVLAELAGRWAHFDVVAYEDELMRTLIISRGFADLEVRDGELWNQMVFCAADTVTDQDIEVSISDEATSAIVPVAVALEVTEVDGLVQVVRPATPTAIGIDLEDPANDPLPTDPDDPRIVDDDGDGNPGVTSRIKVTEDLQGEIYLARREIFSYELTREGPDRLAGTVIDRSEQLIIGASDPVFLTPAQWEQVDDPTRSPVIWERVDDGWDCERLDAERAALFPPDPEPDW